MPTAEELKILQNLPLELKIKKTKLRIKEFINEFGEDGVFVSFSGGKDSVVLLNLVRELYPSVEAVFVDTGLEYPEIRKFVKTFDNVTIIKPEMNFKQVLKTYGYPFISKEVATTIYDVKTSKRAGRDYTELAQYQRLTGNYKINGKKAYSKEKYQFLMSDDAPEISPMCCRIMKKNPIHKYQKTTNKHPIIATMTEESSLRKSAWLKNGCNSFNVKDAKSAPMSFWTEQDVLLYIKQNNISICSVYGNIVSYYSNSEFEGQIGVDDFNATDRNPQLKTTGCDRTGCMFCGFGCHLNNDLRFVRMKETHPKQYEWIMKPTSEGGLGYKETIDWLNENGNLHIMY